METALFDYDLPAAAVAQEPREPRHSARLLDTRDMSDRTVVDLPQLLEPGDIAVVNSARVRHARLRGKRATGGKVEALVLHPESENTWAALVRPARKVRRGTRLRFGDLNCVVVAGPEEGRVRLRFDAPDPESVFPLIGEIPLPPYFHGDIDPSRYQTMFAQDPVAAAAPTAGLHFTPEVVAGLEKRGVGLVQIELAVGVDTFRPVAEATIEAHRMHHEAFAVPAAAVADIAEARSRGGRVVAVGTTVVRALEAAAAGGSLQATTGSTDLYLRPGSPFRVVDLMVTNFHLPRSTLLVLLEAFMGPGWRGVYETALQRGYRFLSFGDAMLAAPAP